MKTISILGSTGSIGRQTLEVAAHLGMKVVALSAHSNEELLKEQARQFGVETTAVASAPGGEEAVCEIARSSGADIIVAAISGEAGLEPTLAAVRTGKRVALANKESLVCAGELVMSEARRHGTQIIPVDSEHSAIFQCLTSVMPNPTKHDSDTKLSEKIQKIILTASGGPFRTFSLDDLKSVTPEMALRHPNWDMGQKVTIDSATMMNKGLEVIEAMHLFDVPPEQIEVVIHPESIIHSMVELTDGSILAQMSHPDMRMPIQYALTYPERAPGLTRPLDLTQLGSLSFEKPDLERFPCLALAYKAAKAGTDTCAAMNRANEDAVNLFLNGEIKFTEIAERIEKAINKA